MDNHTHTIEYFSKLIYEKLSRGEEIVIIYVRAFDKQFMYEVEKKDITDCNKLKLQEFHIGPETSLSLSLFF